jgi:hypothetical protein
MQVDVLSLLSKLGVNHKASVQHELASQQPAAPRSSMGIYDVSVAACMHRDGAAVHAQQAAAPFCSSFTQLVLPACCCTLLQKHEVSNQRLEELLKCLTKQDLWDLCKEQPTCTAKAADAKDVMVAALVHCQLQLTALSKDHLKRICEKQGLAQTGNKDDLISRLLAGQQQQGHQDKPPAKQTKAPAKQEKAPAQKEQAPAKQAKAWAQQEPPVEHKKVPAKQCKAAAVRPPAAPGAPVVSGTCQLHSSCWPTQLSPLHCTCK